MSQITFHGKEKNFVRRNSCCIMVSERDIDRGLTAESSVQGPQRHGFLRNEVY